VKQPISVTSKTLPVAMKRTFSPFLSVPSTTLTITTAPR
jgi:hypothetical protein